VVEQKRHVDVAISKGLFQPAQCSVSLTQSCEDIAILLAKSKAVLGAIFKLKFLLSFFAFLSIYAALYGAMFGLGFAALILIHEMGHFIDIKRRGLPADMPVFFTRPGCLRALESSGRVARH
jgi:Zn-dependent protease